MKGTNPYGSSQDGGAGGLTAGPGIAITGNTISQARAPWVLQLIGATYGNSGPYVGHGVAYPTINVSLGSFVWEFWARPQSVGGAHYALEAGVGGSHPILIGFDDQTGGLDVTGNFNTSTVGGFFGIQSQASDKIQVDEWVHILAAFDDDFNRFALYINGLCTQFGGPTARFSTTLVDALSFGAGNHQPFKGFTTWMAGWDANQIPFNLLGSAAGVGFMPDISIPCLRNGVSLALPDFLFDYSVPGQQIVDQASNQSPPLTGGRYRGGSLHPGQLLWGGSLYGQENESPLFPHPIWVLDATCPQYLVAPRTIAHALVGTPIAVPVDATYLAWDSFGSRRSTFVESSAPTLGSTEAGTLGPLAYAYIPTTVTDIYAWGVCWGMAAFLGINSNRLGTAVVNVATANHGAQVRRGAGCATGDPSQIYVTGPGLLARYVDQTNYWYTVWYNSQITVHKVVAGVDTPRAAVSLVAGADSHRLVATGDDWTLYSGATVANVTTWTLIDSFTDAALNTGTRAGMAASNSMARYQTFGVIAS